MNDIKTEIINVLVKESMISKDYKLEDLELDLLQNNMIDSLNILSLISLFEDKFAIEFDSDDILGKNWMTVNAIINTITRKTEETSGENGR